jgi:hypothetical protein
VNCKHCGSGRMQSRGDNWQCLACKKYAKKQANTQTFTENREKNTAEVSASIPRIMSDNDLLDFLGVDRSEWKITKVVYGKSEGYRKDRQVSWDVQDGKVISGRVRDSGDLLIKPLFSVKVWLARKVEEKAAISEVEFIKKEAVAYAPKYKKIKHQQSKDGFLYEIAMPDFQLGRMVQEDEAGVASTPDLYIRKAEAAIDRLLSYSEPYKVNKILFPIGNDFFNSNTAENMTAHGTPQRDDPRWQRTYRLGKQVIIQAVEKMTEIAPVDIMIVKGNHDEERIFYFGDTLESWFHFNPNVTVDNRPIGRKYYSYGNALVGFAHGYYETPVSLDGLMAYEQPELWAKSIYREWHLGDKHHKKDMLLKTDEYKNGVVVRIFRSLAPPSVWEYDKAFVGSLKAAEAFMWSVGDGLLAQFTAAV